MDIMDINSVMRRQQVRYGERRGG